MPRRDAGDRRGFALPAALSLSAAGLATLTAATLLVSRSAPADKTPAPASPVAESTVAAPTPITWTDLAGKRYGSQDLAGAKATVFLFSSTQCPIANRYSNRFADLHRAYSGRGVRFFLVNSNAEDDRATLQRYARERKLSFPIVKDEGTALADHLKASATPEAVVVDPAGVVRYLGRIDDNQDPAKVTKRDLREALDALLAGQPVPNPRTRAFGCVIFREDSTVAKKPAAAGAVTYARDIAPILNENCVSCHRKGDVGPFSLDTYAMAKTWAPAIKEYTARRIMPPWKAVPGYGGPFHDERWLSDEELHKIAAWADSGAPLGDKKDMPPPPALPPAGEWALGKPDIVLKPVRPYHLDAEGEDVYRDFTLPIDFEKDTYVKAFDFQPGNRGIVHHIIAYMDLTGETSRLKDNKEKEPGWSVSGAGSGIKDEDWASGWAPGMNPRHLPPGVAVRIPKGAKLVLQVHYHKTGKPEVDHSAVGLYLAKEPTTEVLRTAPVGNPGFVLKPNVADNEVKAAMITPFPVKVYAVLPHMHLLGKEMEVTATLPDGSKRPLILVRNWEFNWQMAYLYTEPIKLPKGTRIDVRALYDNTANNRNQPFNPPRPIHFGEQTTDEMCFAFVGFSHDREAERAEKAASVAKAEAGQ